nr:hypothetical protein BaRGS_023898 [Batillaria attramentaria]
MVWEPFIIRYKDGNRTQYTGLCVDLLEYIARDLNFTYVISEPPDLSWGHRLPNGTWVGMTAMLKRKEADLALAGMSVTSERATVSDYSEGFYFDELALLVSRPTEEIGWTFFLRPFHWLVYIALGGSLIFVTAVFVFLERLGDQANMKKDQGNMRRDQGNMRRDQGNMRGDQGNIRRNQANMRGDQGNIRRDQANMRGDQGYMRRDQGNIRRVQANMTRDQADMCMDEGNMGRDQAYMRKDQAKHVAVIYKWRQTPGGRILLSSWILVSLVTVTTYTANLTAFSVVTRQRVPFNTLRQLVKRDDYRWGFLSGTMLESILPHSSNEDYTSFYRGAVSFAESDPSVLSPDVDVQMAQVNSGQYVFLGTLSIYHHYKSRYCQLTVVSERLFTDTFAVHLQKHSPYTRLFNKAIEDAIELGLVDYWSRKRFPNNYRCAGEEKAEVMSLSLEHVQSAFLVAGMGLVAAALVFGLECLPHPQGDVCNKLCGTVGIDDFVKSVVKARANSNSIYFCELLGTCPVNDEGDAQISGLTVSPEDGPQGNDVLLMAQNASAFPSSQTFTLNASPAPNCDPDKQTCEKWLPGKYTLSVAAVLGPDSDAISFQQDVSTTTQPEADINRCSVCVDFAHTALSKLVNIVLSEYIELLRSLAAVCDELCETAGIERFVKSVVTATSYSIYFCELLGTCPINDEGDAQISGLTVSPESGPQGNDVLLMAQNASAFPSSHTFTLNASPAPSCVPYDRVTCEKWLPGKYTFGVGQ